MQFGIRLPNSGPLAARENLVQVADEAERLGFHSVWVHDHILWGEEQHQTHLSAGSAEALNRTQAPNFFESVTSLAYVAGRTKKVRLGIAVLVLPLRNPLVLGKQLANIDVLSEGRLIVGVAPGAPNITKHEFEAIGVPYEERGIITDEYISALKKIWNEPLPSFAGKYVNFKDVQVFPKPVQKNLRILVGGGERGISPRALRRVVERGDGWIPAYLTDEEIKEGISKIIAGGISAGREGDWLTISHEMFVTVDRDSARARALAAQSLATNFVSVEEGEKRSLVGNPHEVAEKLHRYDNARVDITELKFIYSDIQPLLEMMDLFAGEIMPQFQHS